MADMRDDNALTGSGDMERGGSLLARISTQMVRAMKQYYGKGPIHAKSYMVDDLLFIVMRNGMTQAEQTMLDAGREHTVRNFRQEFENEMGQLLTDMIEQLTGRRVINYQSQVLFDPHMTIEIFVFDDQAGPEEREETAQAIVDEHAGAAPDDELAAPRPRARGHG